MPVEIGARLGVYEVLDLLGAGRCRSHSEPQPPFGAPVELPRAPRPEMLSTEMRGYDVLRDGRVISVSPVSGESTPATAEFRVMLNWFEELRRLAPPE